MLDALSKSRIRFITQPPRAGVGALRRRLRPRLGKAGRRAEPSRTGADQLRDRRGQRRARFDSDGGDRRRHPVLLLRPSSAPGIQPAPGRRPVADLPAVLQARLPRRSRRRPAARHGARVPSGDQSAGPARCWSMSRWTSSPRICRSTPSTRSRPRLPAPRSTRRPPSGSPTCSPKPSGR